MSCFIEKWNPPLLTDTQTKYKVVKQASNRIFHNSIVHVFSCPVLLWGLTMGLWRQFSFKRKGCGKFPADTPLQYGSRSLQLYVEYAVQIRGTGGVVGVLAGQPSSAWSVFHWGPAPSGGLSGKCLLIMWIPEFLMVYKIRGERAGWVMLRVGNDRVGTWPGGGRGRGGGKSGGKVPGGKRRGGGTAWYHIYIYIYIYIYIFIYNCRIKWTLL